MNKNWLITGGAIALAIGWVITIDRYADSDGEILQSGRSGADQSEAKAQSGATSTASSVGPWGNATNTRQRKETLSIIQELQERNTALEAMAPAVWGSDDLIGIAVLTDQGDEAYRAGDYALAREIFGQALSATNTTILKAAIVAEQSKQLGRDALLEGDLLKALEAFGIATAIDPTDKEAAAGLTSASVRDRLDAAMVRGEFFLKTSDFDNARAQFMLAAQLDPTDQRAAEALVRTRRLEELARLSRLTRQGYEAIEANKFQLAINRFSSGLALSPGSQDAQKGLKLAERRLQLSHLEALQTRGTAAESREDWQGAASAYQAALQLDASRSFAVDGLERVQRYLVYEETLGGYIGQPLRLTSAQVAQAAKSLVHEISQTANLPKGLSAKTAKLERLLDQMSAIVDVTISSDGQSNVVVQRFGKLGKLKRRTIGLKYGKYVLTARRIGYVDKRMELEIPVGSQPLLLTLYCDEPI